MGLRKFVSIAAVMLLMLALSGCGGSSAPAEDTTQPPETTQPEKTPASAAPEEVHKEKNGLPTGTDYPAEALAQAALADKKRSGDSITIVVPKAIGDCELKRIPVTELLPIIAAGLGG